jgi:uncharacterized protein YndB with AHSA1/START domain
VVTSGTAKVTLPSDTQIRIERAFAAPPELVWRALTEPDLVRRWWAGQRGEVTLVEIDLRVGGSWRYVMTAGEGFEVAFHGEYRELDAPGRIVHTEVYEGAGPDAELAAALVTSTLTATDDGGTRFDLLMDLPSTEVRDMIIASGMEGGMQESYDLLDQVADSLA